MMELYQIYLITNKVNNKKYVGQVMKCRGYKLRFYEHLTGTKYANTRRLSSAIKHYGKENFKVELIEDNIPENIIDKKECFYIKKYDTYYRNKKGYNMTLGGQGIHGYKHTESDIQKISEKSKEFWEELRSNPEKLNARNKKISKKLTGRKASEETKHKLSVAAKNRFKNCHGTFYGKHHSDKSKKLIADKNGYKIGMYDKNTGELLKTFISAMEASRYLIEHKLTSNKSCFTRILTICNNVKGQSKTAYGYIWKYL